MTFVIDQAQEKPNRQFELRFSNHCPIFVFGTVFSPYLLIDFENLLRDEDESITSLLHKIYGLVAEYHAFGLTKVLHGSWSEQTPARKVLAPQVHSKVTFLDLYKYSWSKSMCTMFENDLPRKE